MDFVFTPPVQPSVAVAGEAARFPVRRIFCVGRNYAAHAREMGSDPTREPPFFFTKPGDAVLDAGAGLGASIAYPPLTCNFHHEVELAVALKSGGAQVDVSTALDHVFGYATSLDLTRRDLQFAARDAGKPWDWGKGFDGSAPMAPIHRVEEVGHLAKGRIWLELDGVVKQNGDLSELTWGVAEVISIISRSVTLAAGDLILTGTPAGVGPMVSGQRVRAGIDGLGTLELGIR